MGGWSVAVVTAAAMLGTFLAAVDSTVVSTAMPTTVAQLGGLSIFSWVFSAYMLTSTTSVPIFGRLCDIYGRKPFYILGIAVFILGSALCGQAQSMGQLIVFRAVQGIGAGAIMPITMTIIGDVYPLEQRARMQGLFSSVWGVASLVGPLVGGLLVDHLSWRWVFYVNLPFGSLAAFLVYLALEENLPPDQSRAVDYPGAVSLTLAIVALLLALLGGGTTHTWMTPRVIGLLMAAGVLTAIFLCLETKARNPIVPLSLFRNRIFAVANLGGFLTGMSMFGTISFVPLFVQGVMGTSATTAGAALTPLTLAWMVGSTSGGQLILSLGYRTTAFIGLSLMTTGAFLVSRLGVQNSQAQMVIGTALMGLGGMALITHLIAVQNSVQRSRLGIATSAVQFFRSIGGTIGVSLMGTVLSWQMGQRLEGLPSLPTGLSGALADPQALLSSEVRAQLPDQVLLSFRTVLAESLRGVFLLALVVTVLALLSSLWLPAGKAAPHAAAESTEDPMAGRRQR